MIYLIFTEDLKSMVKLELDLILWCIVIRLKSEFTNVLFPLTYTFGVSFEKTDIHEIRTVFKILKCSVSLINLVSTCPKLFRGLDRKCL